MMSVEPRYWFCVERMAEANAKESVQLRRYQPPTTIIFCVKESCFLSIEIGKATNGVEFLGRRRKADGDAYEPSEHSSFGLYVLGLV